MDRRRKPAIREPRPEITLEEMRAILENITEIESATGIRYVKLHACHGKDDYRYQRVIG